jgi:hypothetical protein
MKVMNKRRVKAHQSEKLCWNERKILSLVDSPFVVGRVRRCNRARPQAELVWVGLLQVCLKYAFTSKEDLFLILDLMRGGVRVTLQSMAEAFPLITHHPLLVLLLLQVTWPSTWISGVASPWRRPDTLQPGRSSACSTCTRTASSTGAWLADTLLVVASAARAQV